MVIKRHLDVLEFTAQTRRCEDLETLTTHFAAIVERFGFSSFVLTGLPRRGYNVAPLVICNHWPAGWTARYSGQNYFADDPVGKWSLACRRPFRWREAQKAEDATALRRTIAGEAWEHGLADGIAYPLHGETNVVISLAAEGNISVDPMAEASIFLAVSYFKAAAETISQRANTRPRPRLTDREVEHLKWMAAGKTAWETSCILSISESTVKLHRASIRKKFGAATTTQAVAIAIRNGIIPL